MLIKVGLHVVVREGRGAEDDDIADWGELGFLALPRVGDRFTLWRHKRLVVLEVSAVGQVPVPLAPDQAHEPMWPADYGPPQAFVTARLVTAANTVDASDCEQALPL